MDKFRLALLLLIFGVKIGTESQRSHETEITQGRTTLKDRASTLKRTYDMKKKNRALCPGEAAFSGEVHSRRSYTHSWAARLNAGGRQGRATVNLDNFSKPV